MCHVRDLAMLAVVSSVRSTTCSKRLLYAAAAAGEEPHLVGLKDR